MCDRKCETCDEAYPIDDCKAVCLADFDDAWACGEFHRAPLHVHPMAVLEWIVCHAVDLPEGSCDRQDPYTATKCDRLKEKYGPSDLLSDSEVRECIACGHKCVWLEHNYPTCYQAEPYSEAVGE